MSFTYFPHSLVRPIQRSFMKDVHDALHNGNDVIAHAPTGIGKTAAVLTPLVEYALKHKLTIFFLTSRHTQHDIVMRTVRDMKAKHNVPLVAASLIGKKEMCAQEGTAGMYSNDFLTMCKSLREKDECLFYLNTRNKKHQPTPAAARLVEELNAQSPISASLTFSQAVAQKLCPYEVSLLTLHHATIIVCDYFYVFAPSVRDSFLARIGKKREETILVIDEGHNLPDRARDLFSQRMSSRTLKRAIREARDLELATALDYAVSLQDVLTDIANEMQPGQEKIIRTEDLTTRIALHAPMQDLIDVFEAGALDLQVQRKNSAMATIAQFLKTWKDGSTGVCRLCSVSEFRQEPVIRITKRCLDPGLVTAEVIHESKCTILMSGTLVPTTMYRDLLGFAETTVEEEYESPFPDENRLALIIPKTTTKYAARSQEQYRAQAHICADIVYRTPGCTAIFFPSYALLHAVLTYLDNQITKTLFVEERGMTKEARHELLKRFASYKETGAVLLGVAGGSFGEGIDLPGVLRSVVVVGLPLDRPDLETKELITYYNEKFGRGVDYGYILPALRRTLQNAGRCIRSEHDQGALIFLDERYTWPLYRRCFPQDWHIAVTEEYAAVLDQFFDHKA